LAPRILSPLPSSAVLCSNKFFETFSFLPPLTGEQISKQVRRA
jgi:ribulose bisphosphate carboxylase small subunit